MTVIVFPRHLTPDTRHLTRMEGKRVLIVDDNQAIRAMVSEYLQGDGYQVEEAADGIQGLDRGLSSSPDVIVLDVVMPGIDGFKLCQLLRDNGVVAPIIMLTEKADLEDKKTGFTAGADDYLPKPFNPLELELRIQALLRRASPESRQPETGSIKYGGLEINLDQHRVSVDGKDVTLTPIEFNILKLLASRPGHVYSRQDLLNAIWETAYEG